MRLYLPPIALTAGLLVAVMGATPAFAAPVPLDNQATDFGPDSRAGAFEFGNFALGDTLPSAAWAADNPQGDFSSSNWDSVGYFGVGNGEGSYDYYAGSAGACTEDANGADRVIVCDDEDIQGLSVQPEVYEYADFNLRRLVWVLSNEGSATIETTVVLENYSECDEDGFVTASTGETAEQSAGLDSTDWNWMVQRAQDDQRYECEIEASAWQSDGAEVRALDEGIEPYNFDEHYITFDLSVAAGETVALAFFYGDAWTDDNNEERVPGDPANPFVVSRLAATQAQVDFFGETISDWNDTTSRGVDSELNVVNWAAAAIAPITPVTPVAPELAATGSSEAVAVNLVGIAALLSAIGAGLVAVRRRNAAKV